jgi:hypothetical protein
LISGGADAVCPTNEIEILGRAACPGSKTLMIQNATHGNVCYWMNAIAEPAKQWFAEHLQSEQ